MRFLTPPRRRRAHARLAAAMLATDGRIYGYELSRAANVRSALMYPFLRAAVTHGWIRDEWERPRETRGKRPSRRYYYVTAKGGPCLRWLARTATTREGQP